MFIIKIIKYFFIGLISIIGYFPYYTMVGIKFIFSKKNTNAELKKIEKKIIPITILTLSITTYLISIFILTRWFVQNERSKNSTENLANNPPAETIYKNDEEPPKQDDNTEEIEQPQDSNITEQPQKPQEEPQIIDDNLINVDLNYHLQKNPETVGWIKVNGTKVNYPIVQHSDNDFYLEHDFYQRKTANGWIFADYRNNFETFDNNTIIYGHNLINNTMFGSLTDLLNKNFIKKPNNHYIKLSTKNTNSVWKIFSVYKINPTTDYLQAKFNSTVAYQEFLDTIKNRSYYDFNQNVTYDDKIITLSTCDNTGTKRVVIHAKLINIENK